MISGTLLYAGGQQESETADSVTEITFMTWNSGFHLEVDQKLADAFMAENPLIKVELISVPQGFDDKVLTSNAAGNTPDGLVIWNTPQFVEAGVVEDLTPYIERDGLDMGEYHPVTKQWAEYKGGIYGLPKDYTPRAIYYNKNVFDEAGVAYPQDGWTFDDFTEITKKLTNGKEGADARYGYVAIPGHTYAIQGYIWSNGGELVSKDGKTATGYINSQAVVEVAEWYKELFDMSMTTSTMDAYQNLGQDQFQTGIVGMMDNGSWPIDVFSKDTSLDFGIVAPPVPKAGMKPSPVIHSATYSMFAKAKNKDAVWEYIKFVGGVEGGKIIEELRYGISAIPSVTESSGLADVPYIGDFYRVAAHADHAPAFTTGPKWFEADGEFKTALEEIFLLDRDATEALNEAARKMDAILQN